MAMPHPRTDSSGSIQKKDEIENYRSSGWCDLWWLYVVTCMLKPSNIVCFLSFLDLLLSSGISIIHPNLSIVSNQLLLSLWPTIQVSSTNASIYSPWVWFYDQWDQACLPKFYPLLVLIANGHHVYHKEYYWPSIIFYVHIELLLANLLHSPC